MAKAGRPKGEPRATRGVNLPLRYWIWLKCQPEPSRQVIMRLIKAEMTRQKQQENKR